MNKKEWQPYYDRLIPFFEDAARTHYEGDLKKGFKFWAISEVLTDTNLSDDEIGEPLRLDGSSDLGIDGYYEDAENQSLILVQSKFHATPTSVGNDELNRFLSSLKDKVLNPDVVVAAATRNPLVNDAHRAVRDAIQAGWSIRFIFVTSGYLSSPEGQVFAQTNQTTSEVIDSVTISKELEVYDIEGLTQLYDSHLSPTRFLTDVELALGSDLPHESRIGDFRVLVTSLPAKELVKAFRQHQYALFRLNPRGPLQNKTNRNIKKTLEDPNKRKLFFHLNNGITAVCDGFTLDRNRLSIRDFQIVNGCQTTVTLWKTQAIVESDSEIKVLLRLIEGLSSLKEEIAEATNTQARLAAQDFKSRDKLQVDFQRQFEALPAPVFYEIKRGNWEMLGDKQGKFLDRTTGKYRRVKMTDLAQATLAFLGEPGVAKDRSRDIFEKEAYYKSVFPANAKVEQLMLPWQIYQLAEQRCKDWTTFVAAPYARFCLTALVGAELLGDPPAQPRTAQQASRSADDERFKQLRQLPSAQEASRLSADNERIGRLLIRGQEAISALHAALGDEFPGPREFFRSADFFDKVLTTFRTLPSS